MADTLLIERGIGEIRIAEIEDGQVLAFGFENPDDPLAPGRCHLGRIARLEPALAAAFVDLGRGAHGFLSARRLPPGRSGAPKALGRRLFEGQKLLVQVSRGAHGEKSAELTARPALGGLLLVYEPYGEGVVVSRRITDGAERTRLEQAVGALLDGGGFVVRTAASGALAAALAAEAAALQAAWRELKRAAESAEVGPLSGGLTGEPMARLLARWVGAGTRRILVDSAADQARARHFLARFSAPEPVAVALHDGRPPLFAAHGAETALQAALEPVVGLPGGGRLIIEATRALTAIDVDTGADTAAGRPAEARRAINLSAARAIPGELRRRAIGGLVVIDFLRPDTAKAKAAGEAEILQTLRAGLDRDPAHTQLGRFSRLGLVDLARQRGGPSLAEATSGPAAAAKQLLRQALAEAQAGGPGAIEISANPAVAAAIDATALAELGQRTGRPCRLGPPAKGGADAPGTVAIL